MAYVQGNTHQNGSTSSTTVAVTLTNPVGNGNLICVSVGYASSATVTAVADNKGNTYQPVDLVYNSSQGYTWATFYLSGVANGPQTITATLSGSTGFSSILADEFSGIAAVSPLDGHAINTQNNPPTATDGITSGSTTTTANGDLIYGSAVDISSLNSTAHGTGFTLGQAVAGTFYTEYLIQPSAGSTAATFTANVNAMTTAVMAFKAAASGGTTQSAAGVAALGHWALGHPPDSSTITLPALVGTFSLTGQAAPFAISEAANAGSFAFTGVASTFTFNEVASVGTFSFTGVAATFNISEAASAGTFTLTGMAASSSTGGISVAPGVFNFVSPPAVLNVAIGALPASYAFTGIASGFSRDFINWVENPLPTPAWTPAPLPTPSWKKIPFAVFSSRVFSRRPVFAIGGTVWASNPLPNNAGRTQG